MIEINICEAVAAVVYMLLLMSIGFVFKSLNSDINDYLRAGCKATWWLIGVNGFMASFSAMTFTAIAGQSFVAGWSVPLITISGALVYLIHALYLAPKFRQMRVVSGGDILYSRFGRAAEQFSAYYGVLGSLFGGALMLLGTATFVSTVFGFPLWALIIVVGVVVTVYASFGGSWGIMAADFIQASVLLPVTIAITVLCLLKAGGLGNIFSMIDAQGLTSDFAIIKSADHVYQTPVPLTQGLFTWSWLAGLVILQLTGGLGLGARYISVKDGKEARKAAIFTAVMLCFGALIWYLPAIVARLMYYEQVMAIKSVPNVADAAYAVVCTDLLPRGLIGVMAMAILSATMSSMDGTFNGTSALVIRNVYPPMARLLGFTPVEDPKKLLLMGRCINFIFGAILILSGLYFAKHGLKEGLYSYLLTIMAVIGFPASIPMLLGMFSKKTPGISYFTSFGAGLGIALFCFFLPEIQKSTVIFYGMTGFIASIILSLTTWLAFLKKGVKSQLLAIMTSLLILWSFLLACSIFQGGQIVLLWQEKLFLILPAGLLGWLVCLPFWRSTTEEFRDRVGEFYRTMNTPVNFEKEVGTPNDFRQFKLIGIYIVVTGLLMSLLLFVENPLEGKILIGIISMSIFILGILMWKKGLKSFQQYESKNLHEHNLNKNPETTANVSQKLSLEVPDLE